jgi:hypothetical protein
VVLRPHPQHSHPAKLAVNNSAAVKIINFLIVFLSLFILIAPRGTERFGRQPYTTGIEVQPK